MEPGEDFLLKTHPAKILPWGHIGKPAHWKLQRADTDTGTGTDTSTDTNTGTDTATAAAADTSICGYV